MVEKIEVRIDPDLKDLIPGFLDNRAADVAKMRDLLQREDFAQIGLIGHSMKGAGGGYGFDRITEIGAALENAALAADISTIETNVELLADYLHRVEVVAGE